MNPQFTILPDGNLEISLDVQNISPDEKARLDRLNDNDLGDALIGSIVGMTDEKASAPDPNDALALGCCWVSPIEAALGTSKDIIGYCTRRDSEYMFQSGKLWWFPEQSIISPYRILLDTAKVIFTFGDELHGEEVESAGGAAGE